MNRYRSGGPSKASATTLCQKCLKRGHYTYECTAAQQERPYTSRPSRSQQFLNPKLAPRLSAVVPPAEPKPSRPERKVSPERPRRRSVSAHSSDSVSTYSTDLSRSPSPPRRSTKLPREQSGSRTRSHRRDSSGDGRHIPRDSSRDRRQSPPRGPPRQRRDSDRSYDSPPRRGSVRGSSRRRRSRGRSASPERGAMRVNDRIRSRSLPRKPPAENTRQPGRETQPSRGGNEVGQRRERSLSPYSQRIALTRNLNAGSG